MKQFLQYLFSVYFLIIGLSLFSEGNSFFGGLISLLFALLIMPLSRSLIEKKFDFKFPKFLKYSFPFLGFIISLFFFNNSKINTTNSTTSSSSKEFAEIDSSLIENEKTVNNTTAQLLTTPVSKTNKKSNFKKEGSGVKQSHKIKRTTKSVSASTYSAKRKSIRENRSSKRSSYNIGSSYCGHPTKSGGSCRRKVKGGGYCWQHS